MKQLRTVAVILASCATLPLWAEEKNPSEGGAKSPAQGVGIGATLDYSYTLGSDVEFRDRERGDSDAHMVSPTVFGEFPINEKWHVPVGVASEHVFLDTVSGVPMPDQINVMRLNAGVGYRLNDQWNIVVSGGPLFYNLEKVDSQNLGFGGMIRATYKVNPDLTVIGGLSVAPDSEYPVFPAVGAIWKLQTNITLNLTVPRPRLIYSFTDSLRAYVGGEVRFAVFRTDNDIQARTGVARFNSALGTYRDIHVGAGLEYQLAKGLFVGADAGYSVGREIEYTRIDETVSFDPAPYVRVGLQYRF